jgi:transcriptional regulator
MRRMTQRQEAAHGHGWRVDDAPRDYVDRLVRATVGIEIAVERLQGKWKASQNRSEAERARIADATGMTTYLRYKTGPR